MEVRSVCHEAIVPTEWPLRPGSRGCFCVLMPPSPSPPQPRLLSLCLEGQDNCLGAASRWSHPTWVEPNSLHPLSQTDAVWLLLLVCLRRDLGGSCQSLQTPDRPDHPHQRLLCKMPAKTHLPYGTPGPAAQKCCILPDSRGRPRMYERL